MSRTHSSTTLCMLLMLLTTPLQGHALDFRTRPDLDGRFSIAICARPSPDSAGGIPAHAFVFWTRVNNQGERLSAAIGYAPNEGLTAVITSPAMLGPDLSHLSQEAYAAAMKRCLELVVGKHEFDATERRARDSLKLLGAVKTSAEAIAVYNLGQEDTSRFIAEVALRFSDRGLYLPARRPAELPLAYVRRLIDANASR